MFPPATEPVSAAVPGRADSAALIAGITTWADLVRAAAALHDAALPARTASSDFVYKLWDDGELTYEKGGAAYGRRTLHMQARAALPPGTLAHYAAAAFPVTCGVDSYVICPGRAAQALRGKMLALYREVLKP